MLHEMHIITLLYLLMYSECILMVEIKYIKNLTFQRIGADFGKG